MAHAANTVDILVIIKKGGAGSRSRSVPGVTSLSRKWLFIGRAAIFRACHVHVTDALVAATHGPPPPPNPVGRAGRRAP